MITIIFALIIVILSVYIYEISNEKKLLNKKLFESEYGNALAKQKNSEIYRNLTELDIKYNTLINSIHFQCYNDTERMTKEYIDYENGNIYSIIELIYNKNYVKAVDDLHKIIKTNNQLKSKIEK